MVPWAFRQRASLLIRCSREDAEAIRRDALAQHRGVSGYLLFVLERSMKLEERFLLGIQRVMPTVVSELPENRTAIHLRCSAEEALRIRDAAERRLLSISNFVVFSLHRYWRAVQRVRRSEEERTAWR